MVLSLLQSYHRFASDNFDLQSSRIDIERREDVVSIAL